MMMIVEWRIGDQKEPEKRGVATTSAESEGRNVAGAVKDGAEDCTGLGVSTVDGDGGS